MTAVNHIMETHEFDGGDYQKWTITYLHNGYYMIVSVKSGLALSVQEAYVNETNKAIVQQVYNGSDRQMWSIERTDTGSYIIRPKSGESYDTDWCMSAGLGIGTNGRNVEQMAYTNDSNYRDEWELLGKIDATLLCITDANIATGVVHDHGTSLLHLQDKLAEYDRVSQLLIDEDVSTVCGHLATSKVFFSRSHGNQEYILLKNDETLSRNMMQKWSATALSDCDLILFGACLTGSGRENGENLVNAAHSRGAGTVIGFEDEVDCEEMNRWANAFWDAMDTGATVEEACDAGCDAATEYWHAKLLQIDRDITLEEARAYITTGTFYIAGKCEYQLTWEE